MLKTNKDKVVEMFLACKPGMPRAGAGWKVDHKGNPFLLPGIGGITLNVQAGDSAFGLAGDHIEPGVSCTANMENPMIFPTIPCNCSPVWGTRQNHIRGRPGRDRRGHRPPRRLRASDRGVSQKNKRDDEL